MEKMSVQVKPQVTCEELPDKITARWSCKTCHETMDVVFGPHVLESPEGQAVIDKGAAFFAHHLSLKCLDEVPGVTVLPLDDITPGIPEAKA